MILCHSVLMRVTADLLLWYRLSHEFYLYVFDATIMFLVMLVFNVYHPSRIILHRRKNAEVKEPEAQDSTYDLQEQHVSRKR